MTTAARTRSYHHGLLMIAALQKVQDLGIEGLPGLLELLIEFTWTGALLALRYTARHPDAVARLVAIGMPLPTHSAWSEARTALARRIALRAGDDLGALSAGWKQRPPRSATLGQWRAEHFVGSGHQHRLGQANDLRIACHQGQTGEQAGKRYDSQRVCFHFNRCSVSIFIFQVCGPVRCTDSPVASTATVTGMSSTSNS